MRGFLTVVVMTTTITGGLDNCVSIMEWLVKLITFTNYTAEEEHMD